MHHNARSMEAEQQVCSKTPTPEISLQNLRVNKDVDLVQFLSDWLTYAAVKRKGCRVPQRVSKCFYFMSLNAMKCDCGSIFVRYLIALNLLPKNDKAMR